MKLNTIKEMERYARQDSQVVSLGQGIPSIGTDPTLHEAAINTIQNGVVDQYSDPQGLFELRTAISAHLKKYNMDYASNEIIVTTGAIEALSASLQSIITDHKDEVILPCPVYSAYFNAINLAKGRVILHELDEPNGWHLDHNELAKKITDRTAAIVLCNPNNPTGNVYSEQTLNALAHLARKHGIKLIIDEVYRNMCFEGVSVYSPAEIPMYKQTVIRIMSFSKDFSLTGWRIGYLHADSTTINSILGVHDTLVNCAPVVSQYVAIKALEIFDNIVEQNRRIYFDRRAQIMSHLDDLDDKLEYFIPQAGYCIFPKLIQSQDVEKLAHKLVSSGVVTIPGNAFGAVGANHLRLCFGRSEYAIDKGMAIIKEVIREQ